MSEPDRPLEAEDLRALILREVEAARDRPTLIPCPACAGCDVCRGEHMVTPERAAAYDNLQINIEELDEP